MDRQADPMASCLAAILLVVRSSAGTNFVFHYPPNPRIDCTSGGSHLGGSGAEGSDLSDDGRSTNTSTSTNSSDDELEDPLSENDANAKKHDFPDFEGATSESDRRSRSHAGGKQSSRRRRDDHEDDDEEDEDAKTSEAAGPPWETVFGFKTSFLASLLAPRAAICRTKFELAIDDLVFLGYPVQIHPDGTWKKQRKRRRGRVQKSNSSELTASIQNLAAEQEREQQQGEEHEDHATGNEADDEEDDAEDEEDRHEDGSEEEEDKEDAGKMSMFHMVFVLNPPQLEYYKRVQEMYTFVVKKFARALKLEQARMNYVGREAELMLRLREKGVHEDVDFHELWQQILAQSNLASAMAAIYSTISTSKIAHVFLNDSIDLSLQLPIIQETSVLPSIIEPQTPGLFLTTANSFDNDDSEAENLARHFTLLFLDEKENIERQIEKEINAEPTNANSNLLYFVRHCKPTLSFVQIANQAGLPIAEVQVLARHLIYWRRARAIPPIHLRDYYIVSPNADMSRLSAQIPIYSRKFPTLPSLPKMLSSLSSRPRLFFTLIPSKDHRRAYLDILAWLLRHGWVIQLRTFGLLKIPKEIKQAVAREMKEKAEKEKAEALLQQRTAAGNSSLGSTSQPPSSVSAQPTPAISPGHQQGNIPPPSTSAHSTSVPSSITQPTGSHPQPYLQAHAQLEAPSAGTEQSQTTVIDSSEEDFEDSFIREPQKASSIESAWMEMITRDQPADVTAVFERMTRYLNGQHALEKIPIKENISRKECKRVLTAMEKYVCTVRHW
ncbi:nitrogen permease regulator of amino acid transport activity 3-domain-containing protein [Peziza echinospora]|nr:nitrogen permease regulator of amino acid transport activity 3-domain-containing protein [Peziza echinospora]